MIDPEDVLARFDVAKVVGSVLGRDGIRAVGACTRVDQIDADADQRDRLVAPVLANDLADDPDHRLKGQVDLCQPARLELGDLGAVNDVVAGRRMVFTPG